MKKTTLAALAMSLCEATSAHAEKPTDPQTGLACVLEDQAEAHVAEGSLVRVLAD
jgi:hypothetical protein